jgi:catecholate siderophore receptor
MNHPAGSGSRARPSSTYPRRSVIVRLFLFLAVSLVVLPSAVSAQSASARVRGTVFDSSGGVVVGAKVFLNAGASEGEAVTDSRGDFAFDGVPAGTASITVTFTGFSPVTVDVTDSRTDLRVVLEPLPLSEQVTVSETPARIRTATKTDTLLRDVPQAVTVISKDTMAELNMTSMADVVRYVPGISFAQGEGNRDTPIFRGNSSTSDFYVDGVRDDVQYYRDVYNLERVEALKGPNAMIFGRGGVGGVINRVQRVAGWAPVQELSLQLGSYDNRRVSADLGHAVNSKLAARLTSVYENTDSYRAGVGLERYGVNPTVAMTVGANTIVRAGYEYFHDDRTADRGVPSYQGRPYATDPSAFFGNAPESNSVVSVNAVSGLIEHTFGSQMTLRNRVSYADYDKMYQNIFPGAVNADGTMVNVSGYNNATQRQNLFNQTDLTLTHRTGRFDHTILAGMELGRQETGNFRNTAYFTTISPTTTTLVLPITNPVTSLPAEFRQSATDADNDGVATVAALYVQDQVTLSRHFQAVAGLRFDNFNVDVHNNRTDADFSSNDGNASPRLGLIYKPTEPVSIYGSYSVAFLPRAGEQLSSLSLTNQALEPESFKNYEVGAKWDFVPNGSITAAVYDLERGNVLVTDPNDPTVSYLVDAQRTRGVEIGIHGNPTDEWSILGAYAYQDGEITRSLSATVAAGATLANLPKNSFSLWNRYQASHWIGVGVGLIYRSDIFAATDNTVILPSYFRADAAVYFNINSRFGAQVNLENLFDEDYYQFAHSNNNITPGSPRALRVGLTTRF